MKTKSISFTELPYPIRDEWNAMGLIPQIKDLLKPYDGLWLYHQDDGSGYTMPSTWILGSKKQAVTYRAEATNADRVRFIRIWVDKIQSWLTIADDGK